MVAGHGRVDALEEWRKRKNGTPENIKVEEGKWLAPVDFIECPKEKEDALAIRLNLSQAKGGRLDLEGMLATFDLEKLYETAADLKEQGLLEASGIGKELFGYLYDKVKGEEPPEDPGPQINRAEELREKWEVETGQLWVIPSKMGEGEHRIVCGDCTDRAVVARVMGGETAELTVTSPPYGVGKSYETKGIAPWFETIRPCIKLLCEFSKIIIWQLGDLYSTNAQHIEPTMAYSVNMFSECGFKVLWIRIWEKQGINFGVGPYHLVSNKPAQQYEYITAYGGNETEEVDASDFEWVIGFAGPKYRFVKRLNKNERREWGYAGVWKINTVPANKDHPAMFPIELPERCIKMHSDKGNRILEPFSGSGTSLAACERMKRQGRGIEISPAFVAVSLQRLADMGLEPRLEEAC
jgi:DNA modification methylase